MLAVVAAHPDHAAAAARLADRLGLPLAAADTDPACCDEFDALLIVHGAHLALQQTRRLSAARAGRRAGRPRPAQLPGPVAVDFGSQAMRHRRRAGHNELLGRAVGVSARRRPHVLDATAGLGRDAFVLADLGCRVTLCEREPVIAALLEHGLAAAGAADAWLREVAQRMALLPGDVRSVDPALWSPADVIYLDPMFPARSGGAAVKKDMALLQALLPAEAEADGADALWHWAVAQDVARVVVKRPSGAAFLAAAAPAHSLTGKAVRYDVYVRRALG